jgi:ubiquinone/menaquinone biosynthesis C-methylase UbiE
MQFDRIAPYYHGMELLLAGGLMQRCRTAFIPRTLECRRALLAGEGTGRFLETLLRSHPHIHVTCVEKSAKMIDLSRRRLARRAIDLSRVTFQHADLLEDKLPGAGFDLIVTNFFLDCFAPEEVTRLVHRLAGYSSPGSIWLLTDFCIPEAGWRRWRATVLLALLYFFFRRSAHVPAQWLTPPDAFLKACGFTLCERKFASFGFVHSDLWRRCEGK